MGWRKKKMGDEKMYQSPIPVDKDKQCYDCKYYDYDGSSDMSHCLAGHGCGTWSVIDPAGTCENWAKRDGVVEKENEKTV